ELATQGWHVLRFTEQEINEKGHEVMNVILQKLHQLSSHSSKGSMNF
ncbi:DUF559 domain-containing protein, partial [Streptomyces galilaeus]